MIYSLFQLLQDSDVPGARLMDYITFRAVSYTHLTLPTIGG